MKSKKVLFHITTKNNLKSILKKGITRKKGSKCVYLTDNPFFILKVFMKEKNTKEFIVLWVEIPLEEYQEKLNTWWNAKKGNFIDMDFDEYSKGLKGEILYYGKIPPEWIKGYVEINVNKIEIKVRKKK